MRAYNRYIIALSLLLLLTTVILAAFGEERLDLYFAIYLIECLALTSLFAYLNPRARSGLNLVWYGLFAGFGFIVLDKVLEIIIGVSIL